MKSRLRKNIFARKLKFTSCYFGAILASICVSLEQKISAFGVALRVIKLQWRSSLNSTGDSVLFISLTHLFICFITHLCGRRVENEFNLAYETVVRETESLTQQGWYRRCTGL